MKAYACLLLISFVTVTLSVKCVSEIYGAGEISIPKTECTSSSWCAKVVFDGKVSAGGIEMDGEGTYHACVSTKLKKKCDEIGDSSCADIDDVKIGRLGVLKGDVKVCCCKTDLCNGGQKIVVPFITALLVLVAMIFL